MGINFWDNYCRASEYFDKLRREYYELEKKLGKKKRKTPEDKKLLDKRAKEVREAWERYDNAASYIFPSYD